jgi:hypothetical protein
MSGAIDTSSAPASVSTVRVAWEGAHSGRSFTSGKSREHEWMPIMLEISASVLALVKARSFRGRSYIYQLNKIYTFYSLESNPPHAHVHVQHLQHYFVQPPIMSSGSLVYHQGRDR